MESLEKYIQKTHPSIVEEYKRLTTPFYYEPTVIYNPIRSGFGCGAGGSSKPLVIEKGIYYKNGEITLSLKELGADNRYSILLSEAHTSIKRADETIEPLGLPIPNSKELLHMTIDGKNYVIWQTYFRYYENKRLGGRLIIRCDQWKKFNHSGSEKTEFFELYSYIGNSSWSLKHVHSYDSVGREQYKIKHNVSVREFKETVFGNPNIKLKCDLFGHIK
jgi:hypothetical protein